MQTGANILSTSRARAAAAVLTLLSLAGCPDREVAGIVPHPSPQTETVLPVGQNRDVDILFVIDNSGSMGDEQASLVNNFKKFMDKLSAIEGGLPNVHIGVVSSDVGAGGFGWGGACAGDGDDGLLQHQTSSACRPLRGAFIEDVADKNGGRQRNYDDSLDQTFKCIAELGTQGCGFEHHMESMKRALDGSRGENANFLRPDAFLAVVFIADEDDCSAKSGALFDDNRALDNGASELGPVGLRCTQWAVSCDGAALPRQSGTYSSCEPRQDSPYFEDPHAYAEFLHSLKPGHPERVLVAGIFGPDTPFAIGDGDPDHDASTTDVNKLHILPSCGTDTQSSTMAGDGAVPPVRFRALFDEFGDSATRASICDNDLSAALEKISLALVSRLTLRCLPDNADLSDLHPELVGVQPDCAVREEEDGRETPLGRCRMLDQPGAPTPAPDNALPCWYIGQDTEHCSGDGQSGATIEVARDSTPSVNATLVVDCVGI